MENKYINCLIALLILIIIVIRKIWIINIFEYEEKHMGTIRTCKKCGTRQWKSKIVCKWIYLDKKINHKCKCRNHVES